MNLRLSAQEIALIAGVTLCAALIAAMTLGALSTPKDFKDRLVKFEEQASSLRGSAAPSKGLSLRPGAVCAGDAGQQAARMREAIAAEAAALNLTVVRLDLGPIQAATPGATLAGLRVQFEASGSYEGALTLLERIDRASPQVFADTVDLTSKTSSVTISFAGRAFCGV